LRLDEATDACGWLRCGVCMGAGAEKKAWELGVEMQFRREKLRRRVEALGSGFRASTAF